MTFTAKGSHSYIALNKTEHVSNDNRPKRIIGIHGLST